MIVFGAVALVSSFFGQAILDKPSSLNGIFQTGQSREGRLTRLRMPALPLRNYLTFEMALCKLAATSDLSGPVSLSIEAKVPKKLDIFRLKVVPGFW